MPPGSVVPGGVPPLRNATALAPTSEDHVSNPDFPGPSWQDRSQLPDGSPPPRERDGRGVGRDRAGEFGWSAAGDQAPDYARQRGASGYQAYSNGGQPGYGDGSGYRGGPADNGSGYRDPAARGGNGYRDNGDGANGDGGSGYGSRGYDRGRDGGSAQYLGDRQLGDSWPDLYRGGPAGAGDGDIGRGHAKGYRGRRAGARGSAGSGVPGVPGRYGPGAPGRYGPAEFDPGAPDRYGSGLPGRYGSGGYEPGGPGGPSGFDGPDGPGRPAGPAGPGRRRGSGGNGGGRGGSGGGGGRGLVGPNSAPTRTPRTLRQRLWHGSWWRHWTLKKVALLTGGLAALMALVLIAGFFALYETVQVPISALSSPLQQSSVVYFADGRTAVGSFSSVNRTVLTPAQLAQNPFLENAFFAAEDRNFMHEGGISITGTARALFVDLTGSGYQGGSTITEQLIKSYFLPNGSGNLTYGEKLKEIIDAIKLSKSQVAAKARIAAREHRDNQRRKSALASSSLPAKLVDCRSADDRSELFIVEGDSALGTAKTARNSDFQALLPIRGKILNVQKASLADMLKNAECASIIQVIGAGSGSSFDLDSARYQRVIFMADADVDGAHIRTLLLTLFHRYLRPMLDAGRVFAAVPPLHRIELSNPRKGQEKYRYTYSDAELNRTLLELERRGQRWKEPVQRYKGLGEMDASQLAETTMDPRRRTLRRIRIEDAATAADIFNLLMGTEVAPRRDFIVAGAAELDPSRIDT